MSLSLLLGKSHIALAPMNGVCWRSVWFQSTYVITVGDRANTKTYSSICVNLQYSMRPTVGCFIFILGALAQHHLVVHGIGVWDSRFILILVVFLNDFLFSSADILPIRCMLDIENHVSSEH